MWDVKEENLEKFRMICRRRLSPEGALGFMIGTIVYVSVMMFFLIGTLVTFGWDYYTTLFEKTIVKIELVLYSLQIIFLILYSFPKTRFKFQKFQTIVVLLYAFQLGTILFTALILPRMSDYIIDGITLVYVGFLFIGAVIVHIVTTIDTFKQASEGAFSMNERSAPFFSKTKGAMMKVALIYALILLVLIYFHNDYAIDTFIGYVIGTVLLYTVAVGAAEFQLLVYCRFKFKSFNMTWEENERMRGKTRKQNKKSKSKSK
ncbi:hypothetical protein P4388_07650 [Bacillus thuringiensis]|uniref:Uncharacterized protein n=1 Tax=Bacillus thuringiensis TaxID=1428 RepID=A0A9X6WLY1_BACTU|nr:MULTISPECIES: hypothetical protein [Bacillus]KAB2376011.1 hypothetical protein F8510_13165 [Bacillus sp. RM2(2019)]MBK5496985.1 hypothetical protein [Bacillus sp. TH13]MCC6081665.1 hypothetical protein [Bacillus thuringiensis]MED1903322.1 hypothetical protein [Bacillus thuringiensis]MED3348527.1 hypothetical protein [Bacillus thuringiensis]